MPIHHIILLKFKQGITPADVAKVRASLHALPSQIPAISGIKAGTKIKHPMDHDFDEGVIFIFNDEDALRKGYAPHKAHTDYQAYTAPYIEDKLIFDIFCEE
ncbi:hypothetical protein J3R82DRAFT_9464 [Butyriboletus roseoflavus]|nr:hypothetical protein J3R82DRAFT_9464 [Butyriboletus roseoflavus]